VTQETGDDVYCLRCMEYACDPYINAVVTSAQASASVYDALNILLKYYPVVLAGAKVAAETDETLKVHIKPTLSNEPLSYSEVDLAFGMMMKYGAPLLASPVRPIKISLSRPRPNNASTFEAYFNCPVVYGMAENYIELPLAVLHAEIPSANHVLLSHLDRYLKEEVEVEGYDRDNFEDIVKRELLALLPEGTPKLSDIARRLNLSERTLQRKLSLTNLSYTAMLNDMRIDLAKKYLSNTNEPVETVATMLGFTESGNFIRFFKQHTGQTPYRYVKQITLEA
jgi:AraC-like DNA-binding protein